MFNERFTKNIVSESGLADAVLASAELRLRSELILSASKMTKGVKNRLLNVPKLEDANDAGTSAHAKDCTLILTEGDSAKALAVAGVAIVGRDRFGVFPLRGKLLNVRDASIKQIVGNAEVQHLIAILGLDFQKGYITEADMSTLRYGRVCIMTDQDADGSHIKGLVLNLFHHFWPGLLKRPGFMQEFITPIIKVSGISYAMLY